MKDAERIVISRKKWLKVYLELGSVTKAALRCGVARSTLHRWIKRFKEHGESGLSDKSKRPRTLARTKISQEIEMLILDLRNKKKWGSQRISIHLLRKKIKISPMRVWRVLSRHNVKPIVKRGKKSDYKRYNKDVSGVDILEQADPSKLN